MDIRVSRDGKTVDCAVLLEPELETVTREVAPGWKVEDAAPVDPGSDQPVEAVPEADPDTVVRRRLVSRKGTPERVEVRRGETLVELHVLDEGLRVARSIYRKPRPDGAVDIEYRRNADGVVVETIRRDRRGHTIPTRTAS